MESTYQYTKLIPGRNKTTELHHSSLSKTRKSALLILKVFQRADCSVTSHLLHSFDNTQKLIHVGR